MRLRRSMSTREIDGGGTATVTMAMAKLALLERYRHFPPQIPPECVGTEAGTLVRRSFFSGLGEATPHLPFRGESLCEWFTLCAAIAAADQTFTMVELGAGFGRWSVAAGVTAARMRPELSVKLIAVEAEVGHFKMLHQHFLDNGLDPSQNILINGAISDHDGEVLFVHGHSSEWYGQGILPSLDHGYGDWPDGQVYAVPAYSLSHLLSSVDRVDLLDMDIQGKEGDVLRSSVTAIDRKVRRAYVGTHSKTLDEEVTSVFSGLGWRPHLTCPCGEECDTPFGRFRFDDGAQDWANSNSP